MMEKSVIEGLFETMLVVGGRIVLESEHYVRMADAVRQIGADELDAELWRDALRAALRSVGNEGEHSLRSIYQRGSGGAWTLSAEAFDLPKVTLRRRRHGRATILPPAIRRHAPAIKSLDWLVEIRLLRATLAEDVDEGLLVDDDGKILEGTSTNVFAIDGDTLLTPPLDAGILPGTVRNWVIRNAPRVGLSVRHRGLAREDLMKGSFRTSSLSRLSPIRAIDGTPTSDPGERFHELAELFDTEMVKQR